MAIPDDLSTWLFDNIQKLFFPEEWIALDQALSKTELLALFFVERQGEATMTRLAEFMNTPLSTLTGIVDRLVKNGYLERERAEVDRRIVVLKLAERGKSTVGRLKTTISGYLDMVRGALTPEEQAEAMRIALKLMQAFRTAMQPGAVEEHPEIVQRISIE